MSFNSSARGRVREGAQKQCRRLLGADVNKQTYTSQLSPLHLASQHNHIETAQVLLKAGAKLDVKNSEGKVPFEVACTNQMCKPNTRVLLEIHKRNEATIEMLSGGQIRNCHGWSRGSGLVPVVCWSEYRGGCTHPSPEEGEGEMRANVFAARQPMPPINQWVLLHPLSGGFSLLRPSKANIMAAKASGEERLS